MGCTSTLVFLLNIILMLISLIALGGSLYLVLGFKHMNESFTPTFDDAKKKLHSIIKDINYYTGKQLGTPHNINQSDPLDDINFKGLLQQMGYSATAFSVLVMLVSVISTVGSYKNARHVITSAICMSIVLVVVETTFLLLFVKYRGWISSLVGQYFLDDLNSHYINITTDDSFSIGWNVFMQKFKCCGVNNYLDFNASHSFNEMWIEPFHSYASSLPFETAIACCERIETKSSPRFRYPCHKSAYITKKGCLTVFWDAVDKYKTAIVTVFVFLALCQVLHVVLNIWERFNSTDNRKVSSEWNSDTNYKRKAERWKTTPKAYDSYDKRVQAFESNEKWYSGTRQKPMSRPVRPF